MESISHTLPPGLSLLLRTHETSLQTPDPPPRARALLLLLLFLRVRECVFLSVSSAQPESGQGTV